MNKISKPTISVIIAAKNEGHQIRNCINSVSFADEVIVLDSGSSDNTIEEAELSGAVVHRTDWIGYGPQQMRGIALATSEWVFSLDADEVVTTELRDEILNAIESELISGYRIPRFSSFCGQFIHHSGWRPDLTLRLVRRNSAGFTTDFLHAHMTCRGKIEKLTKPIIHYSYKNLDDVLEKLNRYSKGAAIDMKNKGIQSSLSKSLIKGFWAFFRTYFLQQGFRDGRIGLVLALYNSQTTYYKYLRLWINNQKPPIDPT